MRKYPSYKSFRQGCPTLWLPWATFEEKKITSDRIENTRILKIVFNQKYLEDRVILC